MNILGPRHAPETGAINRLQFLAPVFRSRCIWKKISGAEKKHGNEFTVAIYSIAVIIAGIAAKGKLKR